MVYGQAEMAVLFGIIVITLLVLILATLLGGEEGFVVTALAGLGCTAVGCATVASIALGLLVIFAFLMMN